MKITSLIKAGLLGMLVLTSLTAQAQTKQQYGIQGAALTHKKVSSNSYTYVVKGVAYTTKSPDKAKQYAQEGIASFYHSKFTGRKTSNGEYYNPASYTAAHKTLPLNSYVLVTNLQNRRKVIVRINDRGPFVKGRIIDLSRVAAKELGIIGRGLGKVKVEALYVSKDGKLSGAAAHSLAKMAKTPEAKQRLQLDSKAKSAVRSQGNFSGYSIKVRHLSTKAQAQKALQKAQALKLRGVIVRTGKTYELRLGAVPSKKQAQNLVAKLRKVVPAHSSIIYY